MKPERIYVYGAGGHGKVVADILLVTGIPVAAFLDDSAGRYCKPVIGLPVISVREWIEAVKGRTGIGLALGIGNNRARQEVAERCRSWNFEIVTAIHPAAILSSSAFLGTGTVVMPAATINANAEIGSGVIVNTNAVVEHDCVIGDFAHVSPMAALGGGASLGTFSHLGLGAVVLPGIKIGARSTIGAGAVVIHDIPDDVIAIGVPARIRSTVAR